MGLKSPTSYFVSYIKLGEQSEKENQADLKGGGCLHGMERMENKRVQGIKFSAFSLKLPIHQSNVASETLGCNMSLVGRTECTLQLHSLKRRPEPKLCSWQLAVHVECYI